MSRIAPTFAALAKQNRKALIPFVTAGDPDPAMTVPLMHALAAAGADNVVIWLQGNNEADIVAELAELAADLF